jgi:uncharacterized OB-fold protein
MEAPQERRSVFFPDEGYWTTEADGLHLIGSRCSQCRRDYFPPREVCPKCFPEGFEHKMEKSKLSSRGKLYTYSIVQVAPKRFLPPYALGYVDFPEGVRVLGQLTTTDPSQIKIGMTVQAELGRIAVDEQGNEVMSYKFRLL